MSRDLSLCSQRCASGRLIRSLHWLEKECEHESVCGVMEVRLALDIAWAGCIGRGCGDELDALAALSHWSEYDDKSGDQGKSEKMKGRALACTAFFLQWGKTMPFDDSMDGQKADQTDSVLQERLGFQATKLIKLLVKGVTMGDPFAVLHLGVCYYNGDGVLKTTIKPLNCMKDLLTWATLMQCSILVFVMRMEKVFRKTNRKPLHCIKGHLTWATLMLWSILLFVMTKEVECQWTNRKPLNCIKKHLTWATVMQRSNVVFVL